MPRSLAIIAKFLWTFWSYVTIFLAVVTLCLTQVSPSSFPHFIYSISHGNRVGDRMNLSHSFLRIKTLLFSQEFPKTYLQGWHRFSINKRCSNNLIFWPKLHKKLVMLTSDMKLLDIHKTTRKNFGSCKNARPQYSLQRFKKPVFLAWRDHRDCNWQ